MSGKIALVISVFLLFVLNGICCWFAGSYQKESRKVECQILQVVTEDLPQNKNTDGIPVPYTIAIRPYKAVVHTLPGALGKVGDTIKVHE